MNILILLVFSKLVLCTSKVEKLEIDPSAIKGLRHQIPIEAESEDKVSIHWSKSNPLVRNITGEVFRNSEINYEIKLPDLEGYSITLETMLLMEDYEVVKPNQSASFDPIDTPLEFLVHLTPSVSYWTLSPRNGENVIERTLCPPKDDKLRLTVSTSNEATLKFSIKIWLQNYELVENEPITDIALHQSTRSFFFYRFQDSVDHVNIRVLSEGNHTCGLLFVEPHNNCLDQQIPESSLDIQEDEGTKHLTFLEKGLIPYTRRNDAAGILIMILGHHNPAVCDPYADDKGNLMTKLTLSVERNDKGVFYSVLTVSTTALAIVSIATLVSFFIYRDNLQRRFKLLIESFKEPENLLFGNGFRVAQELIVVRGASVSDYYTTMICLMGVFYTLPTFQLVMSYQKRFRVTGDLDICYYNFECFSSNMMFQDFGHVFSNIGYIIFGLAFNIIVYFRHNFVRKEHDILDKEGDKTVRGVKLDSGIFYALGYTSIAEGLLSSCYHVCPTVTNFQFDTTFMYTMSLLLLLKLYQFRHSKATPSSFQTFSLISIILILEVAGYFFNSWAFYIAFVLVHVSMILWAVFLVYKRVKKAAVPISVISCHKCQKNCQCLLLRLTLLGVLINLLLDGYILWEKTPGVSTYILMIIMTNMMMYNVYYVTRKIYCWHIQGNKNEKIGLDTYAYFSLAFVCAGFSGQYYSDIEKSTLLTPAQSRSLNSSCKLGIFDNHDIWHFFSSMGIFLIFMFLLTLEDKNRTTPRDQIEKWNKER